MWRWFWFVLCLLLSTASARADDADVESELSLNTVMITATRDKPNCAGGDECRDLTFTGAGVVLAVDMTRHPVVYTARHVVFDKEKQLDISVSLKVPGSSTPEAVQAAVVKEDKDLDLAILRLSWAPRRAHFSCRPMVRVTGLSSQTELIVVGSPDWSWSRLNRYNRRDERFVYIETPVDRTGYSGGPVFVRGSYDFVGIYQEGAEGIVRVLRVDALNTDLRPSTIVGDLARPDGTYRPKKANDDGSLLLREILARTNALSVGDQEGSLNEPRGCATTSKPLRREGAVLRISAGVAQTDAPIPQKTSPILTAELSEVAPLVSLLGVTLGVRGALLGSFGYLDPGLGERKVFAQGLASIGVRASGGPAFMDASWAPGWYYLPRQSNLVGRSFRLAIGRRFGEEVAGLAVGYLQRRGEPSIMTFQVFSDFMLTTPGGMEMPGQPKASSGDASVDRLLAREDRTSLSPFGWTATTASQENWGAGGSVTGLDEDFSTPLSVGRYFGLRLFSAAQLVGGSARLHDRIRFFASYANELGLRARFFSPNSLVAEAFYYCPLLTYSEKVRFPLVGAGVSVGFSIDRLLLSAVYKYQITKVLYPSQPDIAFTGLTARVEN